MAHAHHSHATTGRALLISVGVTFAFVIVEATAGAISHSLGLLSDAGHNLADVLALLISWYALRAARRPSSASRTYGYHRVGILAAVVNALSLVLIAAFILWEAVIRLHNPPPVQGPVMIFVALGAMVLNGVIAAWLHRGSQHDLNVRGAYLHMLGDALAAAGVVVAGCIVALTGKSIADPIVSILIAVMILYSSWDVLKESVDVLLESSPAGLDMRAVERAIRAEDGVLDAHDLHVWTIGAGVVACSCHVVVAEQSVRSGQQVLRAICSTLDRQFRINHTTVQIEVEGCQTQETYCTLQPREHDSYEGHDHGDCSPERAVTESVAADRDH